MIGSGIHPDHLVKAIASTGDIQLAVGYQIIAPTLNQ